MYTLAYLKQSTPLPSEIPNYIYVYDGGVSSLNGTYKLVDNIKSLDDIVKEPTEVLTVYTQENGTGEITFTRDIDSNSVYLITGIEGEEEGTSFAYKSEIIQNNKADKWPHECEWSLATMIYPDFTPPDTYLPVPTVSLSEPEVIRRTIIATGAGRAEANGTYTELLPEEYTQHVTQAYLDNCQETNYMFLMVAR